MNLKFGTGGIRATIGEGPDHLNLETIREATLGVAAYVKTLSEEPAVAIAYDSRNHSEEFAKEAARVLALRGCRAYIYPKLMPSPALSFAVRHLKCDAGICRRVCAKPLPAGLGDPTGALTFIPGPRGEAGSILTGPHRGGEFRGFLYRKVSNYEYNTFNKQRTLHYAALHK